MNAIVGRIAAAILAAVSIWIADKTGFNLTVDEQATLAGYLAAGLTTLGVTLYFMLYALYHKLLNRKLAPLDTAQSNAVQTAELEGIQK